MKPNVDACAWAASLVWGPGLSFSFPCWAIAWDEPSPEATLIGRLCRGYSLTPAGSLIGLVRALAAGLVRGAILAALYDGLAARPASLEASA